MVSTYTWRVARVDSTPLIDGIAMLYNESNLGALEVIQVRITEPSEMASVLTGTGIQTLVRVSSTLGGFGVDYVKYDTLSADLPAEVVCLTSPVVVEGDILRNLSDCPQLQTQVASTMMSSRVSGKSTNRSDSSTADQIWLSYNTRNPTERIILREGEGISLVQRSGIVPHALTLNIKVCDQSTGATYVFRTRDIGTLVGGRAVWSLMNNVGSGVVLGIVSIMMSEDGDMGIALNTPSPATIRLIRTEGYVPGVFNPDEGAILSNDPSHPLPSGVKVYEGAFKAALPGYYEGSQYFWDTTDSSVVNVAREQRSGLFRQIVRCPRPNRVGDTCATPDNGFDVFAAKVGSGIVLRRGEGLAIAGGRAGVLDNSQLNYFDMRVTFVYRPASIFPVLGNTRIARRL